MTARPDPRFTHLVDEMFSDDLTGLFEAAELVEALVGHPGFRVVERLIYAEKARLDDELGSDRVLGSRAEYAARHGRLSGLRGVRDAITAVRSRAELRLREQRAKHENGAGSPERSRV